MVVNQAVRSNAPLQIMVDFKAPASAGHYVAKYQLRTNDEASKAIGQQVTCDV